MIVLLRKSKTIYDKLLKRLFSQVLVSNQLKLIHSHSPEMTIENTKGKKSSSFTILLQTHLCRKELTQ